MGVVSAFTRERALAALRATHYDVVVLGGGMTGTGVALDAATRGLRVALLDAGDWAVGTSSKSSKMVHGGLRYLQQKEFRLVYENLRERQRLLENAPHLVRPLPFLIPLFGKDGVVSATVTKAYSAALRLYDLTGGWRIGKRYRRISKEQALADFPSLRVDGLVAGFLYYDARGDDARVALTLARSAADHGADCANYVRAIELVRNDKGQVTAVSARDERTGETFSIATRSVVNATGVWADEVIAMTAHQPSHRITPAKGVHVTFPQSKLDARVAAVLPVPGDRRSIFVVPFEDEAYTFVGTTDTAYDGTLDEPLCLEEDVAYLLRAVNAATSSQVTADDITGVWAGLRPLLAPAEGEKLAERTADLSRRHAVTDAKDGVVHITGGKWTTYREMAEDTVDALRPYVAKLGATRTRRLRLHGAGSWRPTSPMEVHLYRRYGDDALAVLTLIENDPSLGVVAIPGQSYVLAEFVFGARDEMATSLIDLLTRRTRAHLHDARATLTAAPVIAHAVAPTLGWATDDEQREVAAYRTLVHREFTAAGLPLED